MMMLLFKMKVMIMTYIGFILEKHGISTTSHEVEIINYLNSNAREVCMLNNYKIIKQIGLPIYKI